MRHALLGFILPCFLPVACMSAITTDVSPENTNNNANHMNMIINLPDVHATQPRASAPLIQSLTANPNRIISSQQEISLNAIAVAPDGGLLQFSWSATRGILSSNTGQVISWSPRRSDGKPEPPGTAIVQLIVMNAAGQTARADINILIESEDMTEVSEIDIKPSGDHSVPDSQIPDFDRDLF